MTRRLLVPPLLLVAAAAPGAAAAQGPASSTQSPIGQEQAAAAPAKLSVDVARVSRIGAVLAGRRVAVRGVLSPYVAGQKVTVRVLRGARTLSRRTVAVRPGAAGTGRFALGIKTSGRGRVVVHAAHAATPEQAGAKAEPVGFEVLPRSARGGGTNVRILQRHLDRLGYVVGRRGQFDGRTARAVIAFRKNLDMARTSDANEDVFAAIAAGRGAFPVRHRNHGRHFEADLSKQVMALIGKGGKVERIYHVSSGAPSTPTIRGSFRVYRKDFGTNALGMVHSSYFIRGYAIHGFKSVPMFGASHGCLRVPVPDAKSIFNWIDQGTLVDVYR